MDLGIKHKKALVCGASKGLGFAIAEALAKEGVDLCLLGRDEKSLKAASEKLSKDFGVEAFYTECDLLSAQSRKSMIDKVNSKWKHIDILIHNVGGPKASTVQETSHESWQDGFDRLFLPVVDLNAAFLEGMKANGWGRIVTVTSLSVMEPIPMLAVSNAIRSASTALSKTLADELGRFGITVNCVAPGMIQTDIRIEELMEARISKSGQSKEEHLEGVHKSIPAGRLGRPEEYGAVVAFVCSEQASYMSGSTIYVDGGKRRSTY